MRHIIVFPAFAALFITSILLGGIMWLYRFNTNDFFKGTRYINSKLIRFTNWYNFSSK